MSDSFVPLVFERLTPEESRSRAQAWRDLLARRRSVRDFAPDPVPLDVLDLAIEAAGSAPSGANRQPWHFVVVSDPELKRRIREAAEAEEREFYGRRATHEWLADLEPLGTDWRKPFLETAPALIVVFAVDWSVERDAEGRERHHKNYYVQESVGIALGLLIATLHAAGLASLTHTPSPMGFLGGLLERPRNERAYVLLPVGYPADTARVPAITKKGLERIRTRV